MQPGQRVHVQTGLLSGQWRSSTRPVRQIGHGVLVVRLMGLTWPLGRSCLLLSIAGRIVRVVKASGQLLFWPTGVGAWVLAGLRGQNGMAMNGEE